MFTRLDAMTFRWTGQSLGGRVARAPTLLLTTIGCRSGKARTTPLAFVRDGHDFLVVAAFGGSPWNPHCLANLRRERRATVDVDGMHLDVDASVVGGSERADLWPFMGHLIKSLRAAEARTDREIPLVRLTPTSAFP
jgi:F420H(2)-dependent quinone reductase